MTDILSNFSDVFEESNLKSGHLYQFIKDVSKGLPRVTFVEAMQLLGADKSNYTYLDQEPIALTSAGEKRLLSNFGEAVWLTHLPKLGVPFYQADASDGKSALCADLIMGIGETVGCGERHTTYEETIRALRERQVSPRSYEWYLRMKKEFPLQTSGFGIGLERFLLWVLDHDDIRDIQPIIRLKGITSTP